MQKIMLEKVQIWLPATLMLQSSCPRVLISTEVRPLIRLFCPKCCYCSDLTLRQIDIVDIVQVMFNVRECHPCRDGRPLDLPLSADYQDTVLPVWSMAQFIHGIINIIPSSPITNNAFTSCCILPTIHTLWPCITLHPKPHPMIIVHQNQHTLNMNRCIPHNLPMLQTQDTTVHTTDIIPHATGSRLAASAHHPSISLLTLLAWFCSQLCNWDIPIKLDITSVSCILMSLDSLIFFD